MERKLRTKTGFREGVGIRYCRSQLAKPLWPQLGGQVAAADVPPCASCQAHRTFEFQVGAR